MISEITTADILDELTKRYVVANKTLLLMCEVADHEDENKGKFKTVFIHDVKNPNRTMCGIATGIHRIGAGFPESLTSGLINLKILEGKKNEG